jgi:hypothetical protein
MWMEYQEGCRLVTLQRTSRAGATWFSRPLAAFDDSLIGRIAEVNIPLNVGEFRLMVGVWSRI